MPLLPAPRISGFTFITTTTSVLRKFILLLFAAAQVAFAQSQGDGPSTFRKALDDDESKFTNVGSLRLTVSNFGTLGHGFNKWPFQPNCEYPAGSGIEHIFEGGLWIGAFVDGTGPHVSTAAVDVSSVRDVAAGFEYTNAAGTRTEERSSLADSRFFSPSAVSHQDFVAAFTDSNRIVPGTSVTIPEHNTPLKVAVHMETYAWNFSFAENFVILNYTITNENAQALDSVQVGIWLDMVVRNTNLSPPRGSAFFNRGGNGFVDSLRMCYEFDVNGDPGFTDSYLGLAVLGSDPIQYFGPNPAGGDSLGARVIFNAWQFRNTTDPVYFSPENDRERYEKMTTGLPITEYPNLRSASNRSVLLTTGPFRRLEPGETVNVVFALVAAKKYGNDPTADDTPGSRGNLYRGLRFAQQAYDGEDKNRNNTLDPGEDLNGDGQLTRYVLPAPPTPPRVRVIPGNQKITVLWDDRAEASVDPISGQQDFEGYRVYRTNAGADLDPTRVLSNAFVLVGEYDRTDNELFYNTGFGAVRLAEPLQLPDDPVSYRYRLDIPHQLNGWQYIYTVTAFDSGDPVNNVESLESSRLQNARRVIPGTTPEMAASGEPFAYPNPYYASAMWDGSGERARKLYFANLPARAEIRIYTMTGDLVKTLRHEGESYDGSDIEWFERFADGTQRFAGGEHAWDLITDSDQATATGMYLFTVENIDSGNIQRGKFVIIK
ncbi:MAG: hypothetical protein RBU27_03090 [Bacteroidota bacterium]|jgi:hypothetical protein|nr:hypothetical protein [Bacteroidota bacterium]